MELACGELGMNNSVWIRILGIGVEHYHCLSQEMDIRTGNTATFDDCGLIVTALILYAVMNAINYLTSISCIWSIPTLASVVILYITQP